MALKDKLIPNDTSFVKLKDYPDGERIEVKSAGVNEQGKYGPQPYFITTEGTRIMLPNRYVDYITEILTDEEAISELANGVTIIKSSRSTQNGGTTPTFEIE